MCVCVLVCVFACVYVPTHKYIRQILNIYLVLNLLFFLIFLYILFNQLQFIYFILTPSFLHVLILLILCLYSKTNILSIYVCMCVCARDKENKTILQSDFTENKT